VFLKGIIMKIHWMEVYGDTSMGGLQKTGKHLTDSGYYSCLLTYHSTRPDFWILCSRILDINDKFKYFLAIRTYAMSPEYFVAMYKAFNEIQKNRIMFNIVSGDIHPSEKSVDDIIFGKENFDTIEKRLDYTNKWIKKVFSILDRQKEVKPEIVMSGSSEQTLQTASTFADYNLCMLNEYKENKEKFQKNNNRMVCAGVTVRNSYKEAEKFVDNIDCKTDKRWSIYGTEKQILEEIDNLEKDGVTDLLIRNHRGDLEFELIHNLVKKYNKSL